MCGSYAYQFWWLLWALRSRYQSRPKVWVFTGFQMASKSQIWTSVYYWLEPCFMILLKHTKTHLKSPLAGEVWSKWKWAMNSAHWSLMKRNTFVNFGSKCGGFVFFAKIHSWPFLREHHSTLDGNRDGSCNRPDFKHFLTHSRVHWTIRQQAINGIETPSCKLGMTAWPECIYRMIQIGNTRPPSLKNYWDKMFIWLFSRVLIGNVGSCWFLWCPRSSSTQQPNYSGNAEAPQNASKRWSSAHRPRSWRSFTGIPRPVITGSFPWKWVIVDHPYVWTSTNSSTKQISSQQTPFPKRSLFTKFNMACNWRS